MNRDRTAVLGAAIAVAVLGLLVGVDIAIPADERIFLSALFALAPLVACAVVPAGGTAVIAVFAVLAAIASGTWNHVTSTPQHVVRILTVAIISAAAIAIAAVRVRREQRFEQMSAIASAAQRAILPLLPRRTNGVVAATRYQSAALGALVGGDLYDCYHSEHHTRYLVGDVRGKGIEGVEQAARVIRAFRQSAALRATLVEVAQEMDDYLADFFDEEEFVTVLLVEVVGPGRLELLAAGHPSPVLVRADGARVTVDLPPGLALGLGLSLVAGFEPTVVPWAPGDRLLLYTDGLAEARDAHGRFLDLDAVAAVLQGQDVDQTLERVLDVVSDHVAGGRLEDDLALVLLENAQPGSSGPAPGIPGAQADDRVAG
jgi:serine phosphatase RsbU (regulator of sigma subunit)